MKNLHQFFCGCDLTDDLEVERDLEPGLEDFLLWAEGDREFLSFRAGANARAERPLLECVLRLRDLFLVFPRPFPRESLRPRRDALRSLSPLSLPLDRERGVLAGRPS